MGGSDAGRHESGPLAVGVCGERGRPHCQDRTKPLPVHNQSPHTNLNTQETPANPLHPPDRSRRSHVIRCTEAPAGIHVMMLGPPRDLRPHQWAGAEPSDAELRRLWRTGSHRATWQA